MLLTIADPSTPVPADGFHRGSVDPGRLAGRPAPARLPRRAATEALTGLKGVRELERER